MATYENCLLALFHIEGDFHLYCTYMFVLLYTICSNQEERKQRDEQIRETIMAKLVETGEKERLKEMLRERLVACGWRDELKEFCKEVIRRKGLEKVTVDDLVSEITPRGRCKWNCFPVCQWYSCALPTIVLVSSTTATIPEDVKAELLKRIRTFLQAT